MRFFFFHDVSIHFFLACLACLIILEIFAVGEIYQNEFCEFPCVGLVASGTLFLEKSNNIKNICLLRLHANFIPITNFIFFYSIFRQHLSGVLAQWHQCQVLTTWCMSSIRREASKDIHFLKSLEIRADRADVMGTVRDSYLIDKIKRAYILGFRE